MPAKPVQISIDQGLLEQVDADPETRSQGRSAFVRSAIQRYLTAKRCRQIDAQIAAAYTEQAEGALADATALIGAQEWPED